MWWYIVQILLTNQQNKKSHGLPSNSKVSLNNFNVLIGMIQNPAIALLSEYIRLAFF